MLIQTLLATQSLRHAWNPQAVSYSHQLPHLMCHERYPTPLQLYAGQDNDINIDDVLLEAESALQAAETSLSSPETDESTLLARSIDAIAGLFGGMVFGALLGSLVLLQFPDLDLLISSPLMLPSVVLGTIGFASGFVNTQTAATIRGVFGRPVKGILSFFGLVARQQVEKGVQRVKSVPSKMMNSMTKKVDKIIEYPSKLSGSIKSKVVATKDELTSVGVVLAVVVPITVWVFLTSQSL